MKDLKAMPKNIRKRLIIKFFTILIGGVGSFTLLFSVVVVAFFIPTYYNKEYISSTSSVNDSGVLNTVQRIVASQVPQVPVRTSFVVYGLDDDRFGADVIILGAFNRLTGDIDLINIPRDTFMIINEENREFLRSVNRRFNPETKITDLVAFGGRYYGPKIATNQLEQWLGIEINYQVSIDLQAFREIVDIVGPVPFNIPRRMFYDDGFGFRIDLQPGLQYLNGNDAEGLIRYRATYVRGDIQRIEVQQKFLHELFSFMLQRENLLNINNLVALVATVLNYVNTDFPFSSVAMYASYLPKINMQSLNIQIMPGNVDYWRINSAGQRISYVLPHEYELRVIINQVFHGISPDIQEADEEEEIITIVMEME